MNVYMNAAGYKYAAAVAKAASDTKLPFVKPELIELLTNENPMPPDMVDNFMARENDTPGFIKELKEAAAAELSATTPVG